MHIENEKLIKQSFNSLLVLKDNQIRDILKKISNALLLNIDKIIDANKADLDTFVLSSTIDNPNYDRLMLSRSRLESIINDLGTIIDGKMNIDDNAIESKYIEKNDIYVSKISVPIGIIGIVYESRPNVTIDIFFNCFRSQNICVLKGGKDAYRTNWTIVEIIKDILKEFDLEHAITLLGQDRSEIDKIIKNDKLIDLCIARGGKELISFIKQNSIVPFIETGAGVVNLYFDEFGDVEKGKKVIYNAKTRRVSVCNALDCILIHKNRLNDLYDLVSDLINKNVIIYADDNAMEHLSQYRLVESFDQGKHLNKEFLSYAVLILTVDSMDHAMETINQNTSHHTEIIISENNDNIQDFCRKIDSSSICVNTSSSFVDGVEMGIGCEIGISTQKLHARGPFSMRALRTIKYIISSNGSIRE